MKKLFLFAVLAFLALPAKAQLLYEEQPQPYFNFRLSNFEKDMKVISNAVDSEYIKARYYDADSGGYSSEMDRFISQYHAKIKAADLDRGYQAKLSSLKKKPIPYRSLGSNKRDICEKFIEHFLILQDKFTARVYKYHLPKPDSKYSDYYNSVLSDERYANLILSRYYQHINSCMYDLIDTNTCSEIVSPFAENVIDIAIASLDMEDMPVFYGAIEELYYLFKDKLESPTITYIFTNAEDLGLYK